MGIFNLLFSWRGRNLSKDDIDFQGWIQAHRAWKQRLVNYIGGASQETLDPAVISCDDKCALGKWIHGSGATAYHDLATFVAMRADHASFHQCAGDIVQKATDGEKELAIRLLHRDFEKHSKSVIGALESLEQEIRK